MEENDDKYLQVQILESKQDPAGEIMSVCIRTIIVLQCPHVFGFRILSHLVFVAGRKDTHL